MKRLISLLLALMLVPLLSQPVHAEPISGEMVTLTAVIMDEATLTAAGNRDANVFSLRTPITAISSNGDLLFSVKDLVRFSGFACSEEGDILTFTRGSKTVTVDTARQTLTCRQHTWADSLEGALCCVNGQWYLSGTHLLPYLNVNCAAQDGFLFVAPNLLSLWDFVGDVNLLDFSFDMYYWAEQLGVSNKKMELTAYFDKAKSYCLTDWLFGSGAFDQKEYYNLFEEFLMDKTAAEGAYAATYAAYEGIFGLIGATEDLVNIAIPGAGIFNETVGKFEHLGHTAVKLYGFNMLFSEDNDLKLRALEVLLEDPSHSYDQSMLNATEDIIQSYEKYWPGVFNTLNYNLTSDLIAMCVDGGKVEDVLNTVLVDKIHLFPKGNAKLGQIPYYSALMTVGNRIYQEGLGQEDQSSLFYAEAGAAMYLYASEQCYRAMTQFAIDNGGTSGQISTLRQYANQAQILQGKFLAATAYLENDSCHQDEQTARRDTYQKAFDKVRLERVSSDAAWTVEQAIFMSFVTESEYFPSWTQIDLDNDGTRELLLQHEDQNHLPVYTVMDTLSMDAYSSLGNETVSLVESGGTGAALAVEFPHYEAYWTWDGMGWTAYSEHTAWPAGFGPEEETFFLHGGPVTQDVHTQAVADLQAGSPLSLDLPAVTESFVYGESLDLLVSLDDHFQNREGCLNTFYADLDNDLDTDRIYFLYGAADQWTRRLPEDHVYQATDRKATVILAVNDGNGIRLRAIRIELPLEPVAASLTSGARYDLATQTLRLGSQYWFYYPDSNELSTLLREGHPLAEELLDLDYPQLSALLQDFRVWEDGFTLEGTYRGIPLEIFWRDFNPEEMPEEPLYLVSTASVYPELWEFAPGLTLEDEEALLFEYMEPLTGWRAMRFFTTPTGEDLGVQQRTYRRLISGHEYLFFIYYRQTDHGNEYLYADYARIYP